MKSKNIFLILFLCCTSLCFAQDKLFEKYADMDNVTSVFISKKMFDMIPNVESGGLNLMNLKGKINNLQIVTSDKREIRDQMRKEFSSLIGKSHEELMRVKDNDTRATFHIVQNGDHTGCGEKPFHRKQKADSNQPPIKKGFAPVLYVPSAKPIF